MMFVSGTGHCMHKEKKGNYCYDLKNTNHGKCRLMILVKNTCKSISSQVKVKRYLLLEMS